MCKREVEPTGERKMIPADKKPTLEDALIMAAVADLRQAVADFRLEVKADLIGMIAAFDRIDGHLKDTSEILTKTNHKLGQRC